jgi:hypothetical protein
MQPTLVFEMFLPKTRVWELLTGTLTLKEFPHAAGIKFLATSGSVGYQYQQSFLLKSRGCLPPSDLITPNKYHIESKAIELNHVKGVAGKFYPIRPFAVSAMGVTRSDLGIHRDANVPGSAGCIVITDKMHWEIYQDKMIALALKGITNIPLTVKYREAAK